MATSEPGSLKEAVAVVSEALASGPSGREAVLEGIANAVGDEAWDAFFERVRLEHQSRLAYRKLKLLAQAGQPEARSLVEKYIASYPHLAVAEPPGDPPSEVFREEIDAVPLDFE